MKQLLQGMETREKVDCLLAQTKIAAGPKVDAIYYHLVQGAGQSRAAAAFRVKQSKGSEALDTLHAVAEHNERYHELKVYQPDTDEQRDARVADTLKNQRCNCDDCTARAVIAINKLFGA